MFPTTKIINYTLVVVTSSLFLQQFCYVFFLVEAKAYDQRRSRYSTQQSQAQMYGGQNSAMTVNHRRGDSSGMDECNSEIGNKTHTYTIKVPNDALDSYAIIKVLQKNQRHTEIKICCPGYNLERNLYGDVCTPVCDDCRNGHCVGPNECECFDGFVRNDNGDCVFSCPLGCLNGRCYLDETCKCDPGYKLDETRRFCRPICSKGCGSNLLLNCTEPEVCSCINGYMLTETGCRAVCSPDCGPGGKCNVHGVCVCEPGYTLKEGVCHSTCYHYAIIKVLQKNQRHTEIKICCPGYNLERNLYGDVCTPVCDDCRNGHCVGPNECECFDGFVRNDNGDCVFSCPLGCLNGRCYLDETCKCDPGYKLDETRRFCRPICSKGCGSNLLLNCTEPEVCSCINGYMLTETGCRAVCSPDCGPGGKCNVHGVCVCEPGYTLKEGVCHSTCYQSCENGMCYSRHRCICNPGYVYMENTGNCEPRS